MSKITKKQYEQQKREIKSKIEACQKLLNSLPTFEELVTLPQSVINHIGDTWNATDDAIHGLKKELYFLDQQWNRRNWTHQDIAEWELVSNNID
jgi:hypothetical protein